MKRFFTENKTENWLRIFAVLFLSSIIMILNPNFYQDVGKFLFTLYSSHFRCRCKLSVPISTKQNKIITTKKKTAEGKCMWQFNHIY